MTPLASWGVSVAVLIAAATLLWAISVRIRDASIVDPFWGPAFALAAGVHMVLVPGTPAVRGWLVMTLVTVWGGRLGIHLGLRAVGSPEDSRYAEMRERNGEGWWLRSLFTVFWLQALLVALISVPLLTAIRSEAPFGLIDLVGLVLFVVGLGFEAVGDAQLTAFRSDPANRGKVLDSGLWRYTRHPNYFGDALLWWGLGLLGVTGASWAVLLAPAIMTWLLLRISGVPLLETRLEETRPAYADYIRRTPAFVPWFPKTGGS